MASSLVSSVSGIAECVFATLFPSGCRLCGAPLVKISRLPMGSEAVLFVPVPLHRGKLRRRGFNQAELITRAVLKQIGGERFALKPGILQRRRETQSQIGLTRHQRRENMRGAFEVANPYAVKGQEILIVDDVFTTGTTVSECARVLWRSGASKVYVATVARTLKAEARLVELPREEEMQAIAAAG